MAACERCHLASQRANVVIYRGGESPALLFVGEAPGRKEDETGLPFMGRAGQILDRAIASLELEAGTWGVINVFMCRPPRNKFDPVAARACRPWLDLKLQLLAPRLVVTLGAHPLEALVPGSDPVMSTSGRLLESGGYRVFPLLHPAATVRRRAYAERWIEDLEGLKATLRALSFGGPGPGGTARGRALK